MLINFSVENFLSFRKRQGFSLEATGLREHNSTNVFLTDVSDLALLKSAAVYGANASGKSNFFKALRFTVKLMRDSAKATQFGEGFRELEPFLLNSETQLQPSNFIIELLVGDTAYKLSFTMDDEQILSEQLSYRRKQKEYDLYKRQGQKFLVDDKFAEGKGLAERTRPNALFLSTVAQFNGPISTSIIDSVNKWTFITDSTDIFLSKTASLLDNSSANMKIKNFILTYDLGFTDIKANKQELEPKSMEAMLTNNIFLSNKKIMKWEIFTKHKVSDMNNNHVGDVDFPLDKESEGTKKFLAIAGPLVEALANGGVLIIDEFTSRLHPFLARFIVDEIHSTRSNPNNCQFVFISHSTFLLRSDIFRRDQVFLLKKEVDEQSIITRLSDLPVRKESSYEGKYFNEDFGYTPKKRMDTNNFLGDL